jgi:hypothetical protein
MKKLLFIVLMILWSGYIYSQSIKVEINSGLGTYRHDGLKSFQDYLITFAPPHTKKVSEFPPCFYYSASVENILNARHLVGINFTYLTSGGRNDIRDYSGEYSLDMHINGIGAGFQYRYIATSFKNFDIYAKARLGLLFSTFYMNERLNLVQADTSTTSDRFRSMNIYCEPALGITWNFWSRLALDFSLGYEIDTKGSLLLVNTKQFIAQPSGQPLTTDWTGLRVLAGLSYRIR